MTAPVTSQAHRELNRQQRWWHETLIDFLVVNPTATHQECSDYFNGARAPSTIALIRNSDSFKAALSLRRQEMRENMDAAIVQKITGVTHTAFDAILEKLNKKRDTLPLNELNEVIKTVGGFVNGPKSGSSVSVTVNNQAPTMAVPVGLSDLQQAQAALRRHQASLAAAPVIEQPIVEVTVEDQTEKVVAASPANSDPA